MLHKPVLLTETIESLHLKPGAVVVDGTLGSGGHAQAIVEGIGEAGRLIGMDQDVDALTRCRQKLKDYPQVSFHHSNFRHIDKVLSDLNIDFVDAVILDIGFSSDQLETDERGFSFEREGPLDMRMDQSLEISAKDLIRDLSQAELEHLFREYGEEPWARRYAECICRARHLSPIETTTQLAEILQKALPHYTYKDGRKPRWAKKHPATRVFQALRIKVNDEIGALEEALDKGWNALRPGGRFSVISFHSLEDRVVKNRFRDWFKAKQALRITKKPIIGTAEEIKQNPRARSAKLRVVEKL